MITTNLYRRAKATMVKVEKEAYEVVSAFHVNHVLQEAGWTIMMAAEEAKYHLLAERVKLVKDEEPVVEEQEARDVTEIKQDPVTPAADFRAFSQGAEGFGSK